MESLERRKIWVVLLPAMFVPGLASLWYFVWLSESAFAQFVYGGAKIFILTWPMLATLLILKRPFRANLKPIQNHLKAVPLGFLIGLPVAATIGLLMMTPIKEVIESATPIIQQKSIDLGVRDNFILFAVFITVFHSLIEEYYWRWFVFDQLANRVSLASAVTLSSVGFMAHHVILLATFFGWSSPVTYLFSIGIAIGGVVWALIYHASGSLLGAWISHLMVDAVIFVIGFDLVRDRFGW